MKVTPPAGGTPTTTVLDAEGRTTELRQHLGTTTTAAAATTRYSYDAAGNLTRITDLAGVTLTTTAYDTVKKGLTSSSSRWLNATQKIENKVNSYDAAGRPTSASLVVPTVTGLIGAGLAGTYTTTTSYHPDGSTRTVGLPATGPIPAETLTTTYTNRNLPDSLTGTWAGMSYTYEYGTTYTQLGEPLRYSYGQGGHFADQYLAYDLSSGRLLTLGSTNETGITEVTTLTYNNAGLITKQATKPTTGAADTRDYDAFLNRFTTVEVAVALDDPVGRNGYGYAGNSPLSGSDPTGARVRPA